MNSSQRKSPLSRSWSGRKLYHSSLTSGLNPDRLEFFLCTDLANYSKDKRLLTLCKLSFTGLAQRIQTSGLEHCHADLTNLALVLESFLNSSDQASLPATVVYDTHSYMGLVNFAQQNHTIARMHFMKALWIVSSSEKNIPREQLAVAAHRLGRSYMACRHYKEALALMQKALAAYSTTGVPKDHSCVVEAQKLSQEATQAMTHSPSRKAKKRLSFIEEESDSSTQTGAELRYA
mmetsp:Transcript_20419/g.44228  ORF Transcript_20419/g.44228 Transcript_20419/m.44228 type:complete len:234 (+) Transcript_20419:227-928(+)|eukprot:CAMPEP_0168733962 /NCGR_PEP_ID=MMETSP0724-20121128/8566_1 /TAXON_ID=265536 /ORGANISM="Amphiprora sp., Strain CCMP467" /LENGTH=233 /DNA_ID=CAMNT_0008781047 /DNA_START=168 /DNA_END=869 /DNA_ORIENTATION=-